MRKFIQHGLLLFTVMMGVGSQYGIIGTILGLITVPNPGKWLTWNICTGDGTVYRILRSVGHPDVKVTEIFFGILFPERKKKHFNPCAGESRESGWKRKCQQLNCSSATRKHSRNTRTSRQEIHKEILGSVLMNKRRK